MKSLKFLFLGIILAFLGSCGSTNKSDQTKEEAAAAQEQFLKTQPLESGLYDADYYDISGDNARKGRYDGRIYFSLSPDLSAFYVFENGNRAKIDYLVSLQKPFEKTDSGFVSTDNKGMPVVLTTDSTAYILSFHKGNSDVSITFDSKPRHTASPVEVLEKINEIRQKAK